MGLLDKLWDDTVAGPRPETGLGKLRKPASFSSRSSSSSTKGLIAEEVAADVPKVTRSIMIKRPTGCPSNPNGTPPTSPAGTTPPISPFSGGGGREWNRFRRKSSSDAQERSGAVVVVETGTPSTPHEV